jgi:hypothetical protein
MPEPSGNQGDPDPTGQGGSGDAPKYVTETQLNKAITARFTAFEKKQTDQAETFQKATVEQVGTLLDEKLSSLKPPDPPKPDPKDGGPDAATAAKLSGLEKQVEKLTGELETERKAKAAETAKARDVSLRGTLTDALSGHGIEGKRALHAIGHLVDSSKRVRLAEDGETPLFQDDSGTDVDLKTGLADWAKSDDAKLYLAPTGASGSGARSTGGGGSPAGSSGGNSKPSVGDRLHAHFANPGGGGE